MSSKDNNDKRIVAFVSKDCLRSLKIAALQSDTTLQLKVKEILERSTSRKNKPLEIVEEIHQDKVS